ncbi:MAG: acyl dehydratase, partial [Gammaproteobacteria bacterium]
MEQAENTSPTVTREIGGVITDAALDALRAKIGQVFSSSHTPYLTQTSSDSVRHWAEGIGDMNPLWVNEDKGKNNPWGKPLATPTILYAFDKLAIGYRGGLPGIHSMFGGSDWRWLRPIAWGEKIHAVVTFKGLIEHPSRFAGRSFQQISEIRFNTDQGETIAIADAWGFRTERNAAAKKGKYAKVAVTSYTAAELQAITERYEREYIRGADTLYVEDITVDEEVPAIIRGPYTVTTAVAFELGWGGLFIKAHGQAMDYYRRHPKAGIINEFGVPEPPEAVHWDSDLARRVGVPAAYDYGPERIAWVGTLLTNWIGDAGFLERLNVQVRNHNIIGDLTTCEARVTDVDNKDGKGIVSLDV